MWPVATIRIVHFNVVAKSNQNNIQCKNLYWKHENMVPAWWCSKKYKNVDSDKHSNMRLPSRILCCKAFDSIPDFFFLSLRFIPVSQWQEAIGNRQYQPVSSEIFMVTISHNTFWLNTMNSFQENGWKKKASAMDLMDLMEYSIREENFNQLHLLFCYFCLPKSFRFNSLNNFI